jgi:hypothetical protein
MKVNEAIEILKTMPQEAEIVAAQNSGGMEPIYSIHTTEVTSTFRDVKLTVVVIDVD